MSGAYDLAKLKQVDIEGGEKHCLGVINNTELRLKQ